MPDADTPITKRLHISGLTPALTPGDLSARLSTFGTVKAVDGFGLQDGLGQPRKFGYVTIETTTGKLARCLNLLSGSTWKGAKLRIGEAKPDFAERLAKERQAAIDEPPRKKRKRSGGVHADDMALVTPDNVAGRGGWKVTPMGRIVRPVRMRPDHPLPPMDEDKIKKARKKPVKKYGAGDAKDGEEKKKKKKRVKDPDVRARRRTIDVTRWPSVHLKGMFLDMEVVGVRRDDEVEAVADEVMETDDDDESDSDSERERPAEVADAPSRSSSVAPVPPPVTTALPLPDNNTDIDLEKKQSLNLLASLFAGKDETDWVGRESVGSDIDEEELTKGQGVMVNDDQDEDAGFEIVPLDSTRPAPVSDHEMEVDTRADPPRPLPLKQQQATKLKDLFAPREEEAGFSLLGHLDLDLELDDEVPFVTSKPTDEQDHAPSLAAPAPHAQPRPHVQAIPLQLNPRQALFFPLPRGASRGPSTKAHPPDLFEVAREHGWDWRDAGVGFHRTGTEEEIRARWEEGRGELTKGWKRRWREAGKVGRRRGGGAAAGDLGE